MSAPSYAEAVARARALTPLLAAHAAEAEKLRQAPPAVLAALHEAGLFRICQPRRVGGGGHPVTIILDVCAQLARGCPSTSWIVGNLASHQTFLGLWPAEGQAAVWGKNPEAQIGSSFVFPSGRARHVEGGYRVEGHWPYSSGIHACEWVIAGAMAETTDSAALEQRYFLLHRDQYELLDNWQVAGLRGTGSVDFIVADAFVPTDRTLSYKEMAEGTAPGLTVNDEPLFRFPLPAAGGYVLLSTLYGAARGALETLVSISKTRTQRTTGRAVADQPALQIKIAEAGALLDAVELIARTQLDRLHGFMARRETLPGQFAVQLRRDSAFCTQLCVRATDIAFTAGGGGALFDSSPLQRAWRDVHAGAAHFGLQWDNIAAAAGRVELGLPSGLPGLSV